MGMSLQIVRIVWLTVDLIQLPWQSELSSDPDDRHPQYILYRFNGGEPCEHEQSRVDYPPAHFKDAQKNMWEKKQRKT